MKTILDRYIIRSVLAVALAAIFLIAIVMQVVDLFQNSDVYLKGGNDVLRILKLSMLNFPSSVIIAIGPAFLFSVTYFLSMLQANNELICLLNSGVSFSRVKRPIYFIALAAACLSFLFNECLAIPLTREHTELLNEMRNITSQSDNHNVTLFDDASGIVLHASRYYDSTAVISDAEVYYLDADGKAGSKLTARKAAYDREREAWVFTDCTLHSFSYDPLSIESKALDSYEDSRIAFSLALFRNMSQDISTMELKEAIECLRTARKASDPESFAQLSTSFYQRALDFLTPLALILIACSINFRFKKNVLLFSLISSIGAAVVYYVARMLTVIMANQGVIPGPWSMLAPALLILLLSLVFSFVFSRS
ncbi:MAG: LptF/LptG family permease [Sphaerochaetaceae bacterium]|jgi:lipopolysaccharide export system permease protein|nr:LptF/LptG family permease [Sphaerochaetaceae bacterium]